MILRRTESIDPACPSCETLPEEVLLQQLEADFGKRYIYFCAKCRKVIGVSHRKGFWMG